MNRYASNASVRSTPPLGTPSSSSLKPNSAAWATTGQRNPMRSYAAGRRFSLAAALAVVWQPSCCRHIHQMTRFPSSRLRPFRCPETAPGTADRTRAFVPCTASVDRPCLTPAESGQISAIIPSFERFRTVRFGSILQFRSSSNGVRTRRMTRHPSLATMPESRSSAAASSSRSLSTVAWMIACVVSKYLCAR